MSEIPNIVANPALPAKSPVMPEVWSDVAVSPGWERWLGVALSAVLLILVVVLADLLIQAHRAPRPK